MRLGWIVGRRLGVVQAHKIRAIGDLSEFFVNCVAAISGKVNLSSVDHVAGIVKVWYRLKSLKVVEVVLLQEGDTPTRKRPRAYVRRPGECIHTMRRLRIRPVVLHDGHL